MLGVAFWTSWIVVHVWQMMGFCLRPWVGGGAQVRLPPAARDLIERLLCDVDDRLGTAGGAAEIKARPPRTMSASRLASWTFPILILARASKVTLCL